MKKGNTILIPIKTSRDMRDAERVEVVFSQAGKVLLIKSGDSVLVNEDNVQIVMSKNETSMFEPGRYVPAEIRAYYDEDTMLTSNVMYRPFDGTLKGDLK